MTGMGDGEPPSDERGARLRTRRWRVRAYLRQPHRHELLYLCCPVSLLGCARKKALHSGAVTRSMVFGALSKARFRGELNPNRQWNHSAQETSSSEVYGFGNRSPNAGA